MIREDTLPEYTSKILKRNTMSSSARFRSPADALTAAMCGI